MSNLSPSTLAALAREYGRQPKAVNAHAESVQEGESGAERGVHVQRLQEQHGSTAERAPSSWPRTEAPVSPPESCASGTQAPARRT